MRFEHNQALESPAGSEYQVSCLFANRLVHSPALRRDADRIRC